MDDGRRDGGGDADADGSRGCRDGIFAAAAAAAAAAGFGPDNLVGGHSWRSNKVTRWGQPIPTPGDGILLARLSLSLSLSANLAGPVLFAPVVCVRRLRCRWECTSAI